jgi:hypothetical protein
MNTADPEALVAYLRPLGFDHRKFDTRPEHYPAVGASLIAALKMFAADAWTQEIEEAWVAAYGFISQVMIAATEEVPASTPRWWDAEVVHHELRTDDIAVLTVRPHLPYPFEAGQHAALTVPEAPQVRRPYSIANAPRIDGTLEFHVRRIERGRLSTALVDRVRSGGSVRLGPATGSMTLPPDSGHGLLCVAGGTGWAPVKAIIEAAAAGRSEAHPRRPHRARGLRPRRPGAAGQDVRLAGRHSGAATGGRGTAGRRRRTAATGR